MKQFPIFQNEPDTELFLVGNITSNMGDSSGLMYIIHEQKKDKSSISCCTFKSHIVCSPFLIPFSLFSFTKSSSPI